MINYLNLKVTRITADFVRQKEILQARYDAKSISFHSTLQLLMNDLEHAKFRLSQRESRPEDLDKIRSL